MSIDSSSWDSVSIRSPHKSKGRLSSQNLWWWAVLFQSAPLTKARGDSVQSIKLQPMLLFQSAPLTKARGDLSIAQPIVDTDPFQSAPLTKARGDRGLRLRRRYGHLFQSAPLTKARGDRIDTHLRELNDVSIRSPHKSKGRLWLTSRWLVCGYCFNPLPSQKQGETSEEQMSTTQDQVSIRSPHKSKGRLLNP